MPLFLDAQEKWDDFLENKITNYEKLRNFDYGPTNKSSVSKLSPYISHRVLLAVSYTHLTLPTKRIV